MFQHGGVFGVWVAGRLTQGAPLDGGCPTWSEKNRLLSSVCPSIVHTWRQFVNPLTNISLYKAWTERPPWRLNSESIAPPSRHCRPIAVVSEWTGLSQDAPRIWHDLAGTSR